MYNFIYNIVRAEIQAEAEAQREARDRDIRDHAKKEILQIISPLFDDFCKYLYNPKEFKLNKLITSIESAASQIPELKSLPTLELLLSQNQKINTVSSALSILSKNDILHIPFEDLLAEETKACKCDPTRNIKCYQHFSKNKSSGSNFVSPALQSNSQSIGENLNYLHENITLIESCLKEIDSFISEYIKNVIGIYNRVSNTLRKISSSSMKAYSILLRKQGNNEIKNVHIGNLLTSYPIRKEDIISYFKSIVIS